MIYQKLYNTPSESLGFIIKPVARFAEKHPVLTVVSAFLSLKAGIAYSIYAQDPKILEYVVNKVKDPEVAGSLIFGGVALAGMVGFLWAASSSLKAGEREHDRRTTTRLRDSMEEYWYRWKNSDYKSIHPLRHLDRHPHDWELAIRAANELGKGEEFFDLVKGYREHVGTRYLENTGAVSVGNKDLESVIRGATQKS